MERLPGVPGCRLADALSALELSHPGNGRDGQSFDGERPDVRENVEPQVAQILAPAGLAEALVGCQPQLCRLLDGRPCGFLGALLSCGGLGCVYPLVLSCQSLFRRGPAGAVPLAVLVHPVSHPVSVFAAVRVHGRLVEAAIVLLASLLSHVCEHSAFWRYVWRYA